MKRTLLMLTALGALALTAGCQAHSNAAVKEVSVVDASGALDTKDAVFVDANSDEFRKANGTVPGAILLANYKSYDVASTLPADKDTRLIFYCTSRL